MHEPGWFYWLPVVNMDHCLIVIPEEDPDVPYSLPPAHRGFHYQKKIPKRWYHLLLEAEQDKGHPFSHL